jgi:hypothetical protein
LRRIGASSGRKERDGAIARALRKEVCDSAVLSIAARWMIGSIDLFNDNHLLDDDPKQRPLLMRFYE